MLRVVTLRMYGRRLGVPAAPSRVPPDIDIALWDSAAAAGVSPPWHAEVGTRFGDGQACAVALHGPHVVAYCWLTARPALVAEIDRLVVPAPEDVYLYDAFTALAWRGRGLFRALLLRLVAFASAHGRARALIFATSRNLASCRAIEQAGFEKLGAVSRIELPGLRGVWVRRARSPASAVKLIGVPTARDTPARGRSSSRAADQAIE